MGAMQMREVIDLLLDRRRHWVAYNDSNSSTVLTVVMPTT
jgi:hypothetical protein